MSLDPMIGHSRDFDSIQRTFEKLVPKHFHIFKDIEPRKRRLSPFCSIILATLIYLSQL